MQYRHFLWSKWVKDISSLFHRKIHRKFILETKQRTKTTTMTAVKLDLYFSIYYCLENDHAGKLMKAEEQQ
jgi:hypothetical protein